MVRVTSAGGDSTLFGIGMRDFHILKAGFTTPRGWHERIYSDFTKDRRTGWLQPGRVRLFYNGVKQNEILWTRFEVGMPMPAERRRFTGRQGVLWQYVVRDGVQ